MSIQKTIKNILPPFAFELLKRVVQSKYGWSGDYSSWEEAASKCVGYEDENIIEKVRASLLKVKNGEAVYERDSVIFDEIQYSWELFSCLMFASAKSHGNLNIIDFGGSLGSTYYQNKKFLDNLENVSWNIIEQKHYVEIGKKEFADDRLKFYYDVDSCQKVQNCNILLLSGVLQYIEKPYELLNNLLKHSFEFIIIERTPFTKNNRDRITVQKVPPSIYWASYPCRHFSKTKFLVYFEKKGYNLIESFIALDGQSSAYEFKGFIFEKKK